MLANTEALVDDVKHLVFTKFIEAKNLAGPRKGLHFSLVDAQGAAHLAVVATDQGDAHYTYSSTPPFTAVYGALDCHNRAATIQWLEQVIRESAQREGTSAGGVQIQEEGAAEKLYFVHSKQVRDHYPDGRRMSRWMLVDQHGALHLAVVGEERETRDGHYTYRAQEPFASIQPLSCSNQAGVFHWLEGMITHHAAAAGVEHLPAATPGGSGARARSGLHILDIGSSRRGPRPGSADGGGAGAGRGARAAGAGAGAFGGSTTKRHTGIVAEMAAKRARRAADDAEAEERALQAAHLSKLRRAAAGEAARRESSKQAALTWAMGAAGEDDASALAHWQGVLAALQQGWLPIKGSDASGAAAASGHAPPPPSQRHSLRTALEALKELAALHVPLATATSSGALDTLAAYTQHPHPAVAAAAQRVLTSWALRLAHTVVVLADARYDQDPVADLEARIARGEVTLVTGRRKQPPAGTATPLPIGAFSPGGAPEAPTPAPSGGQVAAAGGGGGGAAAAAAREGGGADDAGDGSAAGVAHVAPPPLAPAATAVAAAGAAATSAGGGG